MTRYIVVEVDHKSYGDRPMKFLMLSSDFDEDRLEHGLRIDGTVNAEVVQSITIVGFTDVHMYPVLHRAGYSGLDCCIFNYSLDYYSALNYLTGRADESPHDYPVWKIEDEKEYAIEHILYHIGMLNERDRNDVINRVTVAIEEINDHSSLDQNSGFGPAYDAGEIGSWK